MEFSSRNILIACGGTGGHLAPGIALAQRLVKNGHRCELLISSKQVDRQLIQKYPTLTFRALPATAGLGKTHSNINPLGLMRFAWGQLRSLAFCARLMRRFRPDAVVGFGGFSTVSAALCAAARGVPVFLHEANHRVGKTVRVLKGLARTVYLPEGIAVHSVPMRKVKHLGLPLREDLERIEKAEARRALGMPEAGGLLVIMGGSQGSGPLNRWAEENVERLLAEGISLFCLTGSGKSQARTLERAGARAVFAPFSDRMHLLYAAADLVLARAGAGTIAELVFFATPSVLVPYPFAADDHQRANAEALAKKGGTVAVDERDGEGISREVGRLLEDEAARRALREKLREINAGDPAQTMAEALSALPRRGGKGGNLEERFLAELERRKIAPESVGLKFDEPLGPKTTFGIGGPARLYAEPPGERELAGLVKAARKLRAPLFVMGRGSNLLVLDRGFEGLVVRLAHPNWQKIEALGSGRLKAFAGVRLKALCAEACKAGLGGFEFLEGIPATLGGALRMNAGACGGWTFDRVEKVAYLTERGSLRIVGGKRLRPAYRGTPGLKGCVALWAILKAAGSEKPEAIRARMGELQAKRKASQPREPSAGCVFKNPTQNLGAGKLIDAELHLKGLAVGDAKVSPLHANFIVNAGCATAAQVIALINEIRAAAWREKKIALEPEIMLLGGDWKDYLLPIEKTSAKQ